MRLKVRKNLTVILLTLGLLGGLVFSSITQLTTAAYADTNAVPTKQFGVTYWDPGRAYSGYTLYSPLGCDDVWLIDMQGRIVHHWKMSAKSGPYGKLLPNGNLLYQCLASEEQKKAADAPTLSGQGGVIREVDWNNNLVWEYVDPFMHHDYCRLENGNTMVLKYYAVPSEFMDKIEGGIPETEHDNKIWADQFDEVTPEGKVVWSWKSHEHMDPKDWPICPLDTRAEWNHGNTCYIMDNGDILTSFRNLHKICIIDKKTGDIKWEYGGLGVLAHQHDPHPVPPNGNFLIFDNGQHRALNEVNYSRVIELNPKNKEIEWEYRAPVNMEFFSAACSNAQRLSNGNTLICETMEGRIFEVTPKGEIVWEFINPQSGVVGPFGSTNWVFRAYRYGPDFEGFKGKTLDPGNFQYWNGLYGTDAFN